MRIYPSFMENSKKSGNLLIAFLGILHKPLVSRENENLWIVEKIRQNLLKLN